MEKPFAEKYRPKSTKEIQGHDTAVEKTLAFVRNHGSQKKKGLLLYGAAGTGKTSLAYAVAGELDLEIVEVNASDVRNKDAIQQRVGAATKQQSLFSKGKLILLDEIDGLSGTKDRGGAAAMAALIRESPFPVLLTANDPWSKKLSTLRKYVEMVELKNLPYASVLSVLKRVCEKEGIAYQEEALTALARRSGGDLRGALTDLQTLGEDKLIDKQDLDDLGDRRRAESMFTALRRILKGSDPKLAREAVDAVDENIDDVFLWVDENTPREYTKPEDLAAAMDALSRADVFRGRIRRWQWWRFLVYVIDDMTAGVALAKKERYSGFTKYQRSTRPLQYWRANQARAKKDAVAKKVAERTHVSVREARNDILPYIAVMLKREKHSALIDYFELSDDEASWLAKQAA